MRRSLLILGACLAIGLVVLWATGSLGALQRAVLTTQREVQNALAAAIRHLKAGDPGAVTAFLALSFGYGFFHAAGPGHGKMLIGGYGMARRVPFLRLGAIALASSLAQALVAIGLVYAGVWLLGWGRDRMVGLTETVLAEISRALIALIGLWLMWRGWKALAAQHRQGGEVELDHQHGHDHPHGHDHHHDADCGHAHGPSLDEVARVTGLRDALALIAGIAIRPCTGALFLMVVAWRFGIPLAGAAAVITMGLGTALFNSLAIGGGVAARRLLSAGGAVLGGAGLRVAATLQLAAGLVVLALTLGVGL